MGKKNIPATSKEAFRSLDPEKLSTTHKKILEALKALGKGHYQDIAKMAFIPEAWAWKRMSELHKGGYVIRNGERKPLASGKMGFVWELKTEGKQDQVETAKRLKKTPSVQDFSRALQQPCTSKHIQTALF